MYPEADLDADTTIARLDSTMRGMLHGSCKIERESVYGAAIVLPQVARSMGWNRLLAGLTIRSFFFLILNVLLQLSLLYMINKEEQVMDLFGGQMHLCDFGAFINSCPSGPGCTGPLGTEYTAERLYSWNAYTVRKFARDSLLAVFPEKKMEIEEKVDVGEYGLEDYWCRLVCCYMFMLSLMGDLVNNMRMIRLLLAVPTRADSWISGAEDEDIHIGIAGMPLHWKVFSMIFVWVPKQWIWMLTAESGIHFLMDTGAIVDLIVNSVALSFILGVDEIIQSNLENRATRYLMEQVVDYTSPSYERIPTPQGDVLRNYESRRRGCCNLLTDLAELFPVRCLGVFLLTAFFVVGYYTENCNWTDDGRLVSAPMHLPKSVNYDVFSFLSVSLRHVAEVHETFWTMPKTDGE